MTEEHNEKPVGFGFTILFWVLFLAVLTWLFRDLIDWQHNPNQQVQSSRNASGEVQVVLKRNHFGHYVTAGTINGQAVRFLLDTGATNISIPAHIAERLDLQRGYPVTILTANGEATAYRTRLESVAIGTIELTNLGAHINPNVDQDDILLGMNFLKHLELIQRGNTLTLRNNL